MAFEEFKSCILTLRKLRDLGVLSPVAAQIAELKLRKAYPIYNAVFGLIYDR